MTDYDIIKKYLTYNSRIEEQEVKDLMDVINRFIKDKVQSDKFMAIELPFIGLVYTKQQDIELNENNPYSVKKYLKAIYNSDRPNKNYIERIPMLEKKYDVKTKTDLQEILNNPSFKI